MIQLPVPKWLDPKVFTNRETQVYRMVVAGHTNLEIAKEMFIQEKTVRSHTSKIYKKTGVKPRERLVAFHYLYGWKV